MDEDQKIRKEILIFLSDKIRHNDRRKDLSQARKTWKFLAYCNAMDKIEEWGEKPNIHKGQGGALLRV